MFRNLFKHLKSSQYSELEQRVRDATSLDGKTATAAEVERIIEQTKETADNCQLVCSVLLSRVSAPEPPHVTKGLSLLLSLLDSLPPHARAFFVETVIEHNDLFTRLSQINDRVPNAIVIRSGASEAMKLAAEHSLSSNNPAAAQATAAELAANQSSSDASFVASVAPAAAAPPPAAPSGPPPPVSARARQASLASKMHATLSEDINGVSSDAVVYTADGRIAAAPAPSSQPTAYQPIDLRGMSPSVASGSPTAAEAAAAAAAATSTGGGIAAGVPAVAVYDHPDYALVVASGPAYGSTRGNRGGRGVKPQVPPPTVGPSLASRMRAGTGGGTGGSGTGLDDLGAYDPCPSPAMEPTSAAVAGGVPSVALTASSPAVVAAGKKGGMDVDYDEGEAEGESALAIEEGALVGAALGIQGDDKDDDDEEVAFSAGF